MAGWTDPAQDSLSLPGEAKRLQSSAPKINFSRTRSSGIRMHEKHLTIATCTWRVPTLFWWEKPGFKWLQNGDLLRSPGPLYSFSERPRHALGSPWGEPSLELIELDHFGGGPQIKSSQLVKAIQNKLAETKLYQEGTVRMACFWFPSHTSPTVPKHEGPGFEPPLNQRG